MPALPLQGGSFSGLSSQIQVLAHMPCRPPFTLKQLRLSLVNEMHTNLYTGPTLIVLSPSTSKLASDKGELQLVAIAKSAYSQ